ncbi:phage tail tape measure protein [Tepidibacter thalassicus]|uniref:Phage tail tape measure protein, TP901 family, core region n=1 Tax=Tepidibacter thalassicus DSM 15285 TaxID=1123350 RepID=A0A1M5NLN2_9FIRM|nr:phage tail tape measure protein [Tepidibacter thalassicus]SHG90460.1 phage tail tape measure protein, TP901 family, core region [Tepidibacter thalassicus DSM 15285]
MAGGRKEYELLFKLKAALGGNFNSSFQTAMNTTKQLQGTLTKINSLSGKIDGYKKQSNAVEKSRAKLAELTAEHERLQQEMNQTENPSESLRRKFERNARQIATTTTRIEEQERRLGELGEELLSAGVNTNNLEAANGRLARSYEAVRRSQQDLAKINAAQQKNAAAISKTKSELVGTLGVATALGAAFFAGPVKKAREFQAQMSTVKAISGATGDEMELLAAKAKQMGATTQFTAVESGKALEYMSMAGWKTKEMINGLPGVMNLAAASGEDLATVSDIVTDALTAFGMQAKDSGHFADVLAKAASNSNTNVGMMGGSFSYVAPIAGALKYRVEDVGVALGLMANSGIKAEKAGTSLRGVLTRLAKPPKQAQKALQDLQWSMLKADGTVKPLNQTLVELRGKFAGLTEDQKMQYAASIAGKEAMSGFLAMMNASEQDFAKLTKEINNANGAAEKMAAIRLDNYDGQVKLAKSAFEGLQIALGEALLPTITEGMKKLTELVTKITLFADENPELTSTIIKLAAGLAAFKVATLGAKLGFLELKGGALAVQKVFALFRGRTAVAGVEAMGLSSRLTTAGAGIKNYFGGIKGALGGVGSAIGQMFGGKIATAFSGIGKVFGGIGGKIVGAFGGVGGRITSIFGSVGSKIIAGPLGKIGMVVAKPFMSIGKLISPLMNLGGAILGPFSGIFGKIFPVVGVVMLIISAIQILRDNLDKVRGVVERVFGKAGLKVFDKVVATIGNIGNAIKNVFSDDGISGIKKFIDDTFGENPALANFLNAFIDVFATIGNIVGQFISFVDTSVKPVIVEIFNFIVGTVLPMIAQKFAEWAPTIASIIQGLWTIIQGVATAVMNVVSVVMPLIQSIITGALHTIMQVIGGLLTAIKGIINFIVGVFTGDWEKAWTGVKDIFKGIFQSLGGIVKAPLNAVISIVNGVIGSINKVGFDIPDWVPMVGGKKFELKIPKIPMFAKGSNYTPDTFIAGEKGAELITNAKGRKVFTAAQTGQIFNNINKASTQNNYNEVKEVVMLAPMLQAMLSSIRAVAPRGPMLPQLQLAYSTTAAGVTAPTVKADSTQVITKITIHNQPTIHVDGNAPNDLEEKLKKNNEELLNEVEERIRKKEEDERRGRYE